MGAALWNASSSNGMPVHFSAKDCGASSGHYQSSAVVPARPKTGEVFKVTNHFSFDEDITGGSFDVKVHALGGIQLKHATGPLCGSDTSYDVYLALVKVASVTIYGSQCPIAKGPASIKYDVKLSPILPPALGDASFHLTAKDQKGTDIVCVQANLAINLENSHETKNAEIAVKSVEAGSDLSFYADPRLTFAQFAPSFGMPVHFSARDCGASSGHYQSSAVVPARPKTGEVFKVTNHFSFDEDISGGSFDVKVHALGGIQLKHATGPLCGSDRSYDVYLGLVKVASVTIYGSQCPIVKGPASIQYDIKLSPILPPALGDASFHLTAKDQKGTDIACVQALLAINLKNSHEAENADRTSEMVMV